MLGTSQKIMSDSSKPCAWDNSTRYLLSKGYYDLLTKRKKPDENTPNYSSRVQYSDASKACFPFSEWPFLHDHRLMDVQNHIRLSYEKHIAWSREGIRMFFVFHYHQHLAIEEIVEHALVSQDILKEYYQTNINCNFTFWLLGRSQCRLPFVGYHIVYPYIVVDSARGRQITLSMRERMSRKFGLLDVVQDAFEENLAALIPLYSPEQVSCGACISEDGKNQEHCDQCYSTGKQMSTSFYTPIALIGSQGDNISILDRLENRMATVLAETSVVPHSDLGLYTPGFELPATEPELIPPNVQSKHLSDIHDYCMFKQDRLTISKKLSSYQRETNPEVTKQCQLEIRKYHTEYSQAVVSRVDRTSSSVVANLSSGGRSFCRICSYEGLVHKSNRVYFLIDSRTMCMTQMCYDKDCSIQAKKPEIRKRLTQPVVYRTVTAKILFALDKGTL